MKKKKKAYVGKFEQNTRHLEIKCSSYRKYSKEQCEEIVDDFPVILCTEI